MNTVLALGLIWVALDVAALVAISRYRDSLESTASRPLIRAAGTGAKWAENRGRSLPGRSRLPGPQETVVGWIERRGFVRMGRR